jgi:hypothetical protein
MDNFQIHDPLFREAVNALDAGNVQQLEQLLKEHPRLVHERLDAPVEGYFSRPYLLWFTAGNPIRHDKLPLNIAQAARTIIEAAAREEAPSLYEQLNYTLALVASGSVSRECGVQLELIDLLMDAGADPAEAMKAAVPHMETAAAEHLLARGAALTLPAAVGTGRIEEVKRLAAEAGAEERQAALATAAIYGQAESIRILITQGADINAYCPQGYHAHSTPLHQAVLSGSLDAVKALVEAGADLRAEDRIYNAVPLGWAQYARRTAAKQEERERFTAIVSYVAQNRAGLIVDALMAEGVIPEEQQARAVEIIAKEIQQ